MISRYVVSIGDSTFHVGEDLMSLVSVFELFFLLILLLISYARLDRSIIHQQERTRLYILPIYFALVILLTLWYSIEVLLVLLPNIKDSFLLSILYDGHAFFDNFLIIFSFFPSSARLYALYSLLMSFFLMLGSISLSYILYQPDCDYCSLFYPSNKQVYLWLVLSVIYIFLLCLITFQKLEFIKYRPRKSMKIWLCYLIGIYSCLAIGSGLVSWAGFDIGFCIVSGTEIVFVGLYGPLLFYTLVIDSRMVLRKEDYFSYDEDDEEQLLQSLKEIPKDIKFNENPFFMRGDDYEESEIIREAKELTTNLRTVNYVDLDQIKIGRKIGAGAMGEVFYATWNCTPIALKRIFRSDKALADWLNEVKVLSQLSHPNILLFMGVTVHPDGDRCILTEYVDGGSVFDLLRDKSRTISRRDIHRILEGTAIGISYLHGFEIPILHRDLKSHNILIDSASGNVKVADFGLSRPVDSTMTATGTPQWSAPEVTRHEKYSTKADVYSFGIVIYEVLTRSQPYSSMTSFAAACAVAYEGIRPEFSKEVQNEYPSYVELAKKCWKDDPNIRPSFPEIVEFLSTVEVLDE